MDTIARGAVIVALAAYIGFAESSSGWGYTGDTGPTHWASSYPVCGQTKQSPINIQTTSVSRDPALSSVSLSGYDVMPTNVTLSNNGHSAQVSLTGDLTISGGPLTSTYRAAQFHFHWGKNNNEGSEHTVNGNRYPLEMHIVHYNTKYGSLTPAMNQSDGLAVLGLLFQISASENVYLDWVTAHLASIKYKGDTSTVTSSHNLRTMLPEVMDRYYTYPGSLTTPPCFESITWVVFADPIPVSTNQVAKFRELYETDSSASSSVHIEYNYRPVQSLGGRTVRASFADTSSGVTSQHTAGALISLALCLLLQYL